MLCRIMRGLKRIAKTGVCLAAAALLASGCAKPRGGSGLVVDNKPRPQLAASPTSVPPPAVRPGDLRAVGTVDSHAPYRLRPGDPVLIYLRGILPRDDEVQDIVDEKGYVTLPYIDDVMASGKTVSELERHIQQVYIEREIYRSVTVNVVMPSQSFFVQGEVRAPQRYPLVTGMTILQAIAAAGGYNDYADPRRVTLTRAGIARTINMRDIERDPKLDVMIESGDVIRVPRSIF